MQQVLTAVVIEKLSKDDMRKVLKMAKAMIY
jgi:hypothetical protein